MKVLIFDKFLNGIEGFLIIKLEFEDEVGVFLVVHEIYFIIFTFDFALKATFNYFFSGSC